MISNHIFVQEISYVIIPFHAIAIADTVISFFGYSERTKYEKIKKTSRAKLMCNLGKHDTFLEDDIMKCSKYLVKHVYDNKGSTTVVEVRAKKLRSMKNKTTVRLPPNCNSFL